MDAEALEKIKQIEETKNEDTKDESDIDTNDHTVTPDGELIMDPETFKKQPQIIFWFDSNNKNNRIRRYLKSLNLDVFLVKDVDDFGKLVHKWI